MQYRDSKTFIPPRSNFQFIDKNRQKVLNKAGAFFLKFTLYTVNRFPSKHYRQPQTNASSKASYDWVLSIVKSSVFDTIYA